MPEYDRIIENVTLDRTLRLEGDAYDNTLVRNVTIENVDGYGILLRNVENVTIENVTIRNVSDDGIKLSTSGSTHNVTIRDSTISGIGEDGINAGHREGSGVDHTSLTILNNVIEWTGLAGDGEGLRHGIYIQSTDSVIRGNEISHSTDGNGISVRNSALIAENQVTHSFESGIAYFADHDGSGGTLRIEDNIVSTSGYDRGRTDIDLLSVPDTRNLVDSIVVEGNQTSATSGIEIGEGYVSQNLTIDGTAHSGYPTGEYNPISGTSRSETFLGTEERDVFIIRPGGGSDTIEGFVPGEDVIMVSGFAGVDSVRDVAPHARDTADGVLIGADNGNQILLEDVSISQLGADDFMFG